MQTVQSALAIPELKKTETRQALAAYFQTYRDYRIVLQMGGMYPRTTQALPLSLDKPGTEPGTIHAQHKFHSSTEDCVTQNERMYRFCAKLEGKVRWLPEYQREIIWRRFMAEEEPLPSDDIVHMHLRDAKWYVGKRFYDAQKAKALVRLAYALNIEQEEVVV